MSDIHILLATGWAIWLLTPSLVLGHEDRDNYRHNHQAQHQKTVRLIRHTDLLLTHLPTEAWCPGFVCAGMIKERIG